MRKVLSNYRINNIQRLQNLVDAGSGVTFKTSFRRYVMTEKDIERAKNTIENLSEPLVES